MVITLLIMLIMHLKPIAMKSVLKKSTLFLCINDSIILKEKAVIFYVLLSYNIALMKFVAAIISKAGFEPHSRSIVKNPL